jgi:hypothetical protein
VLGPIQDQTHRPNEKSHAKPSIEQLLGRNAADRPALAPRREEQYEADHLDQGASQPKEQGTSRPHRERLSRLGTLSQSDVGPVSRRVEAGPELASRASPMPRRLVDSARSDAGQLKALAVFAAEHCVGFWVILEGFVRRIPLELPPELVGDVAQVARVRRAMGDLDVGRRSLS